MVYVEMVDVSVQLLTDFGDDALSLRSEESRENTGGDVAERFVRTNYPAKTP